jgi:4-amino-4-deoxy-L-arabinose transferase-like glycosyltransferase
LSALGRDYTLGRPSARLVLPLVAAAAIRLWFFVGYAHVDPWDDARYIELARSTLDGSWKEELEATRAELAAEGQTAADRAFVLRRGTYFPIAAAEWLLGPGEWAWALPSLAASLMTLMLVHSLGRRLAGDEVARLSAWFFALLPLDVIYATRALPDTLQAFWTTAAVAAAHEAASSERTRPLRLGLYTFAGFSIFLAYFTRINGLLAAPLALFAAGPAIARPTRRGEPLMMLLALASLLAFDALWFKKATGDVLFPLEEAGALAMFRHNPEVVFRPFSWLAVHCSYQEGVLHHFFKLFIGRVDHYGGLKLFSAFATLGALGLALAVARREKGLLVVWMAVIFLYFQYGPRAGGWDPANRVMHYYLVAPRIRYLELLVPPLTLLGAWVLARVKLRSVTAFRLAVAAAAAFGLARTHQAHGFYRGSMADLRAASQFFEAQAPGVIYSDPWGLRQLKLLGLPKTWDLRALAETASPEEGSWVVLGGSRGGDLATEDVAAGLAPRWAEVHLDPQRAPRHWRPSLSREAPRSLSRRSPLTIFRVGDEDRAGAGPTRPMIPGQLPTRRWARRGPEEATTAAE